MKLLTLLLKGEILMKKSLIEVVKNNSGKIVAGALLLVGGTVTAILINKNKNNETEVPEFENYDDEDSDEDDTEDSEE